MNSSITILAAGGLVTLAGVAAIAGHQASSTARVVSAVATTHTVKVPHEQCHDETVVHQAPVKDTHRLLGTGLGAAIGGILGHQVGGGRGNTLATVAGAAGGAYAGNKVQEKTQQADTTTSVEKRCETTYEHRQEPSGYDVVYDYRGERHRAHLDHDPGTTLPVVDGKVQLSATGAPPTQADHG